MTQCWWKWQCIIVGSPVEVIYEGVVAASHSCHRMYHIIERKGEWSLLGWVAQRLKLRDRVSGSILGWWLIFPVFPFPVSCTGEHPLAMIVILSAVCMLQHIQCQAVSKGTSAGYKPVYRHFLSWPRLIFNLFTCGQTYWPAVGLISEVLISHQHA